MINARSSILISLFLVFLIGFDALQQKYYMDTFNLSEEPIRLGELLTIHFQRWLVWLITSVPFAIITWKRIQKDDLISLKSKAIVLGSGLLTIVVAVVLISLVNLVQQELLFSFDLMKEFFIFFTFQKGLTFFMANATILLFLNNYARKVEVKEQQVEIINLKKESNELNQTLESLKIDSQPQIGIKIGTRLKPVQLNEISWIQADDYCVKIHTAYKSYTLRKSLKTLEVQLKPYGFVRVHRGALLNLEYLSHINFESSTIRLQDESILPVSKSGIKMLKQSMKQLTL